MRASFLLLKIQDQNKKSTNSLQRGDSNTKDKISIENFIRDENCRERPNSPNTLEAIEALGKAKMAIVAYTPSNGNLSYRKKLCEYYAKYNRFFRWFFNRICFY